MDRIIAIAGEVAGLLAVVLLLYIVIKEILFGSLAHGAEGAESFFYPVITVAVVQILLLLTASLIAEYFSGGAVRESRWAFLGLGGGGRLLQQAYEGWKPGEAGESLLLYGLLRLVHLLSLPEGFFASFVSLGSAIGSGALLFRIIGEEQGEENARRGIPYFCLAPFAWMLGLPYFYSVTLLLLLALYYNLRSGNGLLAILFGVLSIFSHMLALLFIPAVLFMAWESGEKAKRTSLLTAAVSMAAAGLAAALLAKFCWGISLFSFYSGLEGIGELFNCSDQVFWFHSVPLLAYLFGAPVLLYLSKPHLPRPLLLFGLLLVPLPLFLQNTGAEISLLNFPLVLALAHLSQSKGLHRWLLGASAIACGLLLTLQMNYILY